MNLVRVVAGVLLALILLTHPYLQLEVVSGAFNAPVADVMAILLVAGYGLAGLLVRARPYVGSLPGFGGEKSIRRPWLGFPHAFWWGAFLVALTLSLVHSPYLRHSAWWILRKPTFVYLTYGVGLAGVVAWLERPRWVVMMVQLTCLLGSVLMLRYGLPMWLEGHATEPARVPGLINNHKAIAVALAPLWVFLLRLWWDKRQYWQGFILLFVTTALLLSLSKTAFVAMGLGLALMYRGWPTGGRGLVTRPGLVVGVLALLTGLMLALPWLVGDRSMVNAFDARQSLNLRSWLMFREHPLLGWGPNMSVWYELDMAPHWRINGVEAHGVFQKVMAEAGLVGLCTWGGFAVWMLRSTWRQLSPGEAEPSPSGPMREAAALLILCLYVSLLLSTEMFTVAHWAPLGMGLGLLSESELRTRVRNSDSRS